MSVKFYKPAKAAILFHMLMETGKKVTFHASKDSFTVSWIV